VPARNVRGRRDALIVPDEQIEKWTRWVEGSIEANVFTMHL
jgi:hypothetical protein